MSELKKITRDENGLVTGTEYKFLENGMIDWRAMIPKEFIYVNPDSRRREKLEKKYGKPYEELDPTTDKIDDADLVFTLPGSKYLLRLRGFTDIKYNIVSANEGYACVNCRINFIPNYESEMLPISFEDNACAHQGNTSSFAQQYLVEIATNRAFCRAVRSFLQINVVNKEELSDKSSIVEETPSGNVFGPHAMLEKTLSDKKITFDKVKAQMIKDGNQDAEKWESVTDIPKSKVFEILGRLQKKEKEKT
jgi:hypothetical protein